MLIQQNGMAPLKKKYYTQFTADSHKSVIQKKFLQFRP